MNRQKHRVIGTTIVFAVSFILAAVMLFLMMWQGIGMDFQGILEAFKGLIEPVKSMFNFAALSAVTWNGFPYLMVEYIVAMVLAALLIIFWIIHLIVLCAKRRPGALFNNILWLIFGAATVIMYFGVFAKTGDLSNPDTLQGALLNKPDVQVCDLISFIRAAFNVGDVAKGRNIAQCIFSILFCIGVVVAYLLGFISVIASIKEVVRNPGKKKVKESKIRKENEETMLENENDFNASAEPAANEGDDIRSYQYAELDDNKNSNDKVIKDEKGTPMIVQHISYGAAPEADKHPAPAPYPYPPYPYYGYPYPFPPFPAPQEKKEEPKAEEAKPAVSEDRPLTAKELRAIVREELNDHDHPEEIEPLTDEQARNLIKEELANYYAGIAPKAEEEPVVETPAPEVEETKPEEVEEDELMTSDDLRDLIKETVQSTLAEQPKEEPAPAVEALSADEVRQVISEELGKQPKPEVGLKSDEVRQVVADELEKQPKPEEGLKADDVRSIVREEIEAAKVQPEDSEVVKNTNDVVVANNASIKEVAEKQLTSDEIRNLIAEELAKYFEANKVLVKEEPAPEPEPEPVVEEPAPEPVVEESAPEPEPAPEEPVATKAPVVRVPFAERVLNMDEDTRDSYNEIKAEALAYGLKSRISNSGDTFRLHTKTYLKLTVAGKGLKLYFALDPNDYRDTPIPVKDVGAKNIYKEIPLCFKVKSALSLKRAKQLIADAAAKDHLEKGEITPYDYVAQLRDYHESKADEAEEAVSEDDED